MFIVRFRHIYNAWLDIAICWWPRTYMYIMHDQINTQWKFFLLFSLFLPPVVSPSSSWRLASASMHSREFWLRPFLSVTQWRPLSRRTSLLLYPTPFLPPMGCLRFSPSFLLNQSKIFGWFFVRFSPFLLTASSLSFFSFWAAFSFFSFLFSSIFRLNSSFLALSDHHLSSHQPINSLSVTKMNHLALPPLDIVWPKRDCWPWPKGTNWDQLETLEAVPCQRRSS